MATMKKVNEIFSDYPSRGNITTAIVESAVLNKRNRTIEVKLSSDKNIEVREFDSLRAFINERFSLEDAFITVNYQEGVVRKPMEEELKDIVFLVAERYPALKAVLTKDCTLSLIHI